MRRSSIAFLRNPTTDAFFKRGLSIKTLASELGACRPDALPEISTGTLETNVRKARGMVGCGSLHANKKAGLGSAAPDIVMATLKVRKAREPIAQKIAPPHDEISASIANVRKTRGKIGCGSLHADKKARPIIVLPEISMEALETRAARKAGELEVDKIDCPSLHPEISASIAEKVSITSGKLKRKSKARGSKAAELSNNGVHAEKTAAQYAAVGKVEEATVQAKENAVQDITMKRSKVVAKERSTNAGESPEYWAAKVDLSTFKRGLQWKEVSYKLLDYGISCAHVKKMLPKCRVLACDTNSVLSTLNNLSMLGMSNERIGHMISRFPSILNISNRMLQSKVDFFESVGIDRISLGKVMHKAFRVIGLSSTTLRGRCEFWECYFQDVQANALCILVSSYPQILTWNVDKTVKTRMAFLEELGVNKKSQLKFPLLLGYTIHKLHCRLHYLLVWGFSFEQIKKITMEVPQLLSLSEDHIVLTLKYAITVMNISFDTLASCPSIWGYNFEKRIKYRYEVLQELKAIGAYGKDISLGYMVKMRDETFSKRFVERLPADVKHSNI